MWYKIMRLKRNGRVATEVQKCLSYGQAIKLAKELNDSSVLYIYLVMEE